MGDVRLCCRCKKNPARLNSKKAWTWCKECRRKWDRELAAAKKNGTYKRMEQKQLEEGLDRLKFVQPDMVSSQIARATKDKLLTWDRIFELLSRD